MQREHILKHKHNPSLTTETQPSMRKTNADSKRDNFLQKSLLWIF